MTGLVLEGGGARGAYHGGAIRALSQNGIDFHVVAGTSVGAINGALAAQGDHDRIYDIWQGIDVKELFGEDFFRDETPGGRLKAIGKIIDEKGFDTSLLKKTMGKYIWEDRVRSSPIDYGLVTFDLTDLKPVEIFKEDIPRGKLLDFIMASSSLPVFKRNVIDGRTYLDGGVYNVLPVNMPIEKGCKKIYAIRTYAPFGRVKRYDPEDSSIVLIGPKENLGGLLDFSPERIDKSLKMGYYDALRVLKGLRGRKYYLDFSLKPEGLFNHITGEGLRQRAALLINDASVIDLDEILIRVLETAASELEMERFCVYEMGDFLNQIAQKGEGGHRGSLVIRFAMEIIEKL